MCQLSRNRIIAVLYCKAVEKRINEVSSRFIVVVVVVVVAVVAVAIKIAYIIKPYL